MGITQSLISERFKIDEGDGNYGMGDYRQAIVLAVASSADTNIAVNDENGTELAAINIGDGETGFIELNSSDVAEGDDGEFEVDSDAEATVFVLRGDARHRPVDIEVDAFEIV